MPRRGETRYRGGYDDWYVPPSRPREAIGGIKAQSKQGSFGQHWWAKRWLAVLEGFNLGARLTRGRAYARQGQVLSVEIDKGLVTATVQGSRPRPYDIRILLRSLTAREWERVVQVIASEALFSAKLLSGEMPQEIEDAFRQAQVALFPQAYHDLETSCSCPDWSNPCKHIAAVYYLLGEEFDRDPFLVFKLRGLEREEFVKLLGSQHPHRVPQEASHPEEPATSEEPEALPSEPEVFWAGHSLQGEIPGEVNLPPVTAAVLRRLGPFPFWRGEASVQDSLSSLYVAAAESGLVVAAGEAPPALRALARKEPAGHTPTRGGSKARRGKDPTPL